MNSIQFNKFTKVGILKIGLYFLPADREAETDYTKHVFIVSSDEAD